MNSVKQLLSISLISLCAIGASHASVNGEVDFDDLSAHYGEPAVEVNLTANLMKMASGFAKFEEPELAEILAKLDEVKVRVYNLNGEAEYATEALETASQRLKADAWETLVTVSKAEENENVRIFSKSTDDVIDGFVVMVVSPEKESGEAVFVNIVGDIDPQQIAKITSNLDININ